MGSNSRCLQGLHRTQSWPHSNISRDAGHLDIYLTFPILKCQILLNLAVRKTQNKQNIIITRPYLVHEWSVHYRLVKASIGLILIISIGCDYPDNIVKKYSESGFSEKDCDNLLAMLATGIAWKNDILYANLPQCSTRVRCCPGELVFNSIHLDSDEVSCALTLSSNAEHLQIQYFFSGQWVPGANLPHIWPFPLHLSRNLKSCNLQYDHKNPTIPRHCVTHRGFNGAGWKPLDSAHCFHSAKASSPKRPWLTLLSFAPLTRALSLHWRLAFLHWEILKQSSRVICTHPSVSLLVLICLKMYFPQRSQSCLEQFSHQLLKEYWAGRHEDFWEATQRQLFRHLRWVILRTSWWSHPQADSLPL